MAMQGCAKCKRAFEGKVGSMDFSGTDIGNLGKHMVREQRRVVNEVRINNQCERTSKHREEISSGIQIYTVLLVLKDMHVLMYLNDKYH